MFDDGFAIRILIAIRSKSLFKIQDLEFNFKHLTRKNLDVAKYDACISQAVNSRIYAYSWYLDAVADNWDVLVYGDYQAVMPLPWRRKYFIHYIYTPAWVQQLGVFYLSEISFQILEKFLNKIPKKFIKISLQLNSLNKIDNQYSNTRNNYILSLQTDYQLLYKNYKKNRKQSLVEAKQYNIFIKISEKYGDIIELHQKVISKRTNLQTKDYQNFTKLLTNLKVNKDYFVYECYDKHQLMGGAIFLYNNSRYYYVLSAVTDYGKSKQTMSVILDQFIADHSQENNILDFEGSMISGIAAFFRSFGTQEEHYYYYQKPFSIF